MMKSDNEVLEFINRKFNTDCNWTTGNCYYFAIILKDRFPNGTIFYDVVNGHFVFKYKNKYYDWKGMVNLDDCLVVEWDNFNKYDEIQRQRIVQDCLL